MSQFGIRVATVGNGFLSVLKFRDDDAIQAGAQPGDTVLGDERRTTVNANLTFAGLDGVCQERLW